MDDPEAAEAQWREEEMQVQETIAACLAKQGFEYVPIKQPEGSFMVHDETDREEEVRRMGVRSLQGPLRLATDGEQWKSPEEFVVSKRPRALMVLQPLA